MVVGYQRFGGPCCLHLQELGILCLYNFAIQIQRVTDRQLL